MVEVDSQIPVCRIFYSWQSDRTDCRNFIANILKKLPNEMSNLTTVNIDRDTLNVPGSPDIGDTVFEKIERCDLFIADISLINDKDYVCRQTPNPNVLIELGYAIKALGWDKILLLFCKDYGDVESIPFDINHRRISLFELGLNLESKEERQKKKTESKNQVINNIYQTIKILHERNLLFGGNKGKAPKFEITRYGSSGHMADISFTLRNVSPFFISELCIDNLYVVFNNNEKINLDAKPKIEFTSLNIGESTNVMLKNRILGYGPGYNNAYWSNIDLIILFSCVNDENNKFTYKITAHVIDAEKNISDEKWHIAFLK